ncbi:THAP domain-containing protein 2-like isoform X3 [Colias croceus]|uniref:THAP domain-containing protein 2-like isoform X3 n=1 Tax=Colias crocea TaxID=72248 RepID=UPI001E27B18C|nr:THAP domain-containing protein 2-like isoform X3 [Colias croceus]
MPSCVFRKCTNYDKKIKKDKGISYHRFPSDEEYLQFWISVVRQQRCEHNWMPSSSSRICSNHFKNEDKYTSKKGLTLLMKNSVPILEEIKYEEDESSDVIEQNEQCSLQKKTNKKLQ